MPFNVRVYSPQPCVERLTHIHHDPANLSLSEAAIVSRVCARLVGSEEEEEEEAVDASEDVEEIDALPVAAPTPVSFLEFQEEQAEWTVPTTHGTPPAPRGGHCTHLSLQTLCSHTTCDARSMRKDTAWRGELHLQRKVQ